MDVSLQAKGTENLCRPSKFSQKKYKGMRKVVYPAAFILTGAICAHAAIGDVNNASFGSDSGVSIKTDSVLKSNEAMTFSVNNHNLTILVLPSWQRVLQDEISARGNTRAELFCAKNETESFQVLVVNKTVQLLTDLNITVANWQPDVSGSRLPIVTLFREHYVKIDQPSFNLKSKLGMYPDALIPFMDPYSNKTISTAKYLAGRATVGSQKVQGYWVDVAVGPAVSAGIYTTTIKVTSGSSNTIAQIPVILHVWDFVLPAKHSLTAWFCGLRDLSSVYGMSAGSSEYDTVEHRHQTFLYQHGIYPNVRKHPRINWNTGDITFTPDYVASLRAFVNEFGTGMLVIPQLATKDPRAITRYLAAYDAFSRANSWAGQYFFYIDEPSTLESYKFVKQCGDIIHTFAPSVKLLVTIDNPPQAAWPDLNDVIDIKVLLFKEALEAKIQNFQGTSKELWAYTALTRRGPNWVLDSSLLDYRIPAWCSYRLGIRGILYWSTTVWAGIASKNQPYIDTWTTTVTCSYKDKHGSYKWNGEGSLLYSGVPAGIQGPVASMRLKMFRDSVEDYDYLKLFESLTNREQAVSTVSSIVKDFVTYDKNPESYTAKRKAIAEMILYQMRTKQQKSLN